MAKTKSKKSAKTTLDTSGFTHTIKDMAKALGLTVGSFRGWKHSAEKSGVLPKSPEFSIPNPESKTGLLFNDVYLDKVKALRAKSPAAKPLAKKAKTPSKVAKAPEWAAKPPTRAVSAQRGLVILEVPSADKDIAEAIFKRFGWTRLQGL